MLGKNIRTMRITYLLKKLKSFNATWLIMNFSFSYQRNFLSLVYSESEENILRTHCQKYFSPHLNCHHNRFNVHFSRITWFVATQFFLLACAPNFINAPLLYCWHWVKRFLTATLFHNFQNIFQTLDRDQRKLVLIRFNLENILSNLALETRTVNNNLIINSTSLQPLLLGALDTKLWRGKESSLHILLIRASVPKASFNGIITAHIWKNLNYFVFSVFVVVVCLQMMT